MATRSCLRLCAVCSQCLGKSDIRRKLQSLPQSQFSILKTLASSEFPADAEKLFLSTNFLCRPCFRAIESVEKMQNDLLVKEKALSNKIRQSGVARGLGLQEASTCKLFWCW